MTQDEQKLAVARAAIKYVVDDAIVGVDSGSTANLFIDLLAKIRRSTSVRAWSAKMLDGTSECVYLLRTFCRRGLLVARCPVLAAQAVRHHEVQ